MPRQCEAVTFTLLAIPNRPTFPTQNPLQPTNGGGENAFVTKINASGSALVYSTYLGGSGNAFGRGIAVDSSGNAYVTGGAGSNFPLMNPIQAFGGGGIGNAFVAKLNPTGSALVYSTYLGGSGGGNTGDSIALDTSGNSYVTGVTLSTDFPVTPGAYQTVCGGGSLGCYDAFVSKINPSGSAFVYSTYLGGSRDRGRLWHRGGRLRQCLRHWGHPINQLPHNARCLSDSLPRTPSAATTPSHPRSIPRDRLWFTLLI